MKPLYKALKINKKINKICATSLEEAIKTAFKNSDYKFCLNSELIDVYDRFRIFIFNNKKLIVKKNSKKDGLEEIRLAKKADKYLQNTFIDGYKLEVVKPTLTIINEDAYIVTEYKGVSLQENLYSKNYKNTFSFDVLFKIVDIFKSLGIMYRGFLPRNTVIDNKNIYLLDWEDAVFLEDKSQFYINKLWETNFLLNWSYFFDIKLLQNQLKQYRFIIQSEPVLLKYERRFSEIISWNKTDIELRNKICETVLKAEKKLDINDNEFCIMPNDLAHLVSDLFNVEIDVLFDISCFILRSKDELLYFKLIKLMSNLIVDLFKKGEKIQPHLISVFLLILNLSIKDANSLNYIIDSYKNLIQYKRFIKQIDIDLLQFYNENDKNAFLKELKNVIIEIMKQFNNNNNEKLSFDLDMFGYYLLNLQRGDVNKC